MDPQTDMSDQKSLYAQRMSKTRSQNGVLGNLLGHSYVIATEKTYAKLLPKMLDVARSAIYGGK